MDAPDARGRTVARLRTARGVAVEVVAFFNVLKPGTYVALSYVDDLDAWREALGVDRAAAILTPDDDHFVELMAGANAGPCG